MLRLWLSRFAIDGPGAGISAARDGLPGAGVADVAGHFKRCFAGYFRLIAFAGGR